MLDAFVAENKTQMSDKREYACDMNDSRKLLAAATARLIGDGKRFRSARELAQRAHTLGYVDRTDSFSRQVARVLKGEYDAQISTADVIARTAGMGLSDFLSADAEDRPNVKSDIKEPEGALSLRSARDQRATLLVESLAQLHSDTRELVDLLISIDRIGGDLKDTAIVNVRNVLRSLPSGASASEHKELKKRL